MGSFAELIRTQTKRDVETLWQDFKRHLMEGIDLYIPTKLAKKRNKHPWIDANLSKLIRKRNKYYTIMRRTKSPRDMKCRHIKAEVQRLSRRSYQTCTAFLTQQTVNLVPSLPNGFGPL